jgi:serine/threonine-protein kinase
VRPGITLLPPEAAAPRSGLSASLPPDLLEQVRKRLGILALLLGIAFAFDPALYYLLRLAARLGLLALPEATRASAPGFILASGVAALASFALWRAARSPRIAASALHTVGLVYEVVICFLIALLFFWQFWLEHGVVANLTWVPVVVVLFPLILPGPPARMLAAAVVSGAMAPLALFVLSVTGRIVLPSGAEGYAPTIVSSVFAVIFARIGARVVYGLGREVAAARAFGSYQLVERLGGGGMGEVWRAQHRLLARPAAIKLISPELTASPEVLLRFEREAQAIAGLRSPHTVTLFDFGVAEGGGFYYVMELLEGLDADRLVREFGPIPPERVIHILQQVCHSLSEAEASGLVHRDIKPANIFLCRYGEDHDFVKVLDFGIVKAVSGQTELSAGATRENVVPGSPAFIAPEQAMGEPDIDARADIYATGCVGYWLLTGRTVFDAPTPLGLLMAHASQPPTAPSARTERSIPPELDALILRCLGKRPDSRPASARELFGELAKVPCAGHWTEERASAWWSQAALP